MSGDLRIETDGDLAEVEGVSEAGIEFVDAYCPIEPMEVIDAGRIVVTAATAEAITLLARDRGLAVSRAVR